MKLQETGNTEVEIIRPERIVERKSVPRPEDGIFEEIRTGYGQTEGSRPDRNSQSMRKRSKRKRGIPGAMILAVLGSIALVLLIVYIIVAVSVNRAGKEVSSEQQVRTYTQEEVDLLLEEAVKEAKKAEDEQILEQLKQTINEGGSMLETFRSLYPDEILFAFGNEIRFFDRNEKLKQNSYVPENLTVTENGLCYVQDGQIISKKGIDVSYHQGEIDWEAVSGDGVEFAFLRAGYRGYESGKMVTDECFEDNVKGALANGIPVGVYFFSQSVSEQEAVEEAEFVLDLIAPYRVTGPIVYDAEKIDGASRTSNLTKEERTDMAIAFCETVKEAGYEPMIYLNPYAAFYMMDLERLERYPKWFAHYGTDMYYPYEYDIWQYTESGRVAGIRGDVDVNLSFYDWN